MELKSVTIRNFRALQDVQLKDIPSFMVLVGANGTGKSTVSVRATHLFTRRRW
jgi:predicted ATPase